MGGLPRRLAAVLDLAECHWRGLTLLAVLLISALSLVPLAGPPGPQGGDKAGHFLAYGAAVFPAALALGRAVWRVALPLFLWSLAVEWLQPGLGRQGEAADALANGLGLGAGALAAMLISRYRERSRRA
jgi:hypothetical protein